MRDLPLVPIQARQRLLLPRRRGLAREERPQEERVVVRAGDEQLAAGRLEERSVPRLRDLLCLRVAGGPLGGVVERPRAQDEVRVQRERGHPVCVVFQRVQAFSLSAPRLASCTFYTLCYGGWHVRLLYSRL